MSTTGPNVRATLTAPEVAEMFGVSEAHIRRHPPVTPIASGRRVLFPRAAVLRVLDGGGAVRTATATPAAMTAAAS
jgi:hypothetical protein